MAYQPSETGSLEIIQLYANYLYLIRYRFLLFNGISTLVAYLMHVIARLELELIYYGVAVKYISNYITGTPLLLHNVSK